MKVEFPWLKDISSVILQQTLRNQKAAFDNFFNPKLNARYPRFKKKDRRQSIRLTKAAFHYRNVGNTVVYLASPAGAATTGGVHYIDAGDNIMYIGSEEG